jgi:hypothetical protein
MVAENRAEVHWQSGVMAVDTDRIFEYPAMITQTLYDEKNQALSISIKGEDGLEKKLFLSNVDFDGECERVEGLPEVIKSLYKDFSVADDLGLVGRKVRSLHSFGYLVGIRKE